MTFKVTYSHKLFHLPWNLVNILDWSLPYISFILLLMEHVLPSNGYQYKSKTKEENERRHAIQRIE